MKYILLTNFILGLLININAQTTITIRPNAITGKDAMIRDVYPISNPGASTELAICAWTFNGSPMVSRSFIEFDFSLIPPGSNIISAKLYLYNNPAASTSDGQHSQEGGTNKMYLQKVLSAWDDETINWAFQPSGSSFTEITVPASTSYNQDYEIMVTSFVQDMVNDPERNFGFLLKLAVEQYYRSVVFASSNAVDTTLHPKVEITYELSTGISDKELLNEIKIYPNPASDLLSIGNLDITENNFISLIDVHGKEVLKKESYNREEFDINIIDLPKGVYFVKIQNVKGVIIKKIIVQ